jgi:glutamate-ammonia-ligase adenylyltransferase
VPALREAYRRELLRVAAGDLTGERTVEQVMVELTDLADALLAAALRLGLSVRRVEPLADPRGGGGLP